MKIMIRSKYPNRSMNQSTNSLIYQTKGGEKRMRFSKIILTLGVVTFILASLMSSWAAEDVRSTKHNLSTNPNILATGTTEVCVFCHTPHGGRTDVAGGAAPIWNRNLSTATYTVYTSPNFDAAGTTPGTPKGVSVACLSCHDGTVAFDALINFGGSGSTDTINFTGPFVDPSDNSFSETDRSAGGPSPFPNLGIDLSNDHPISMEIPCTADPQFSEICANIDNAALTAGKVSPLRRGDETTLPADIRDRVRAYPTEAGKAYIECASCHNPHEATSTRFLRYPSFVGTAEEAAVGGAAALNADRNAGSLLCLSCHQK